MAVAQVIAQVLQQAGASKAGAAGIIGNFQQESSLNPSSAGGLLGQWQGPRMTALQQFAQQQGKPVTDPVVQTQFAVHELQTQYPQLWSMLRTTGNPQQAALAVSQQYERPGNPQNQNRESYAAQAFSQLSGGKTMAAGAAPSPAGLAPTAAGSQTVTTHGFDQAGFNAANARFIAGNAVNEAGSSANPFNASPGATKGFAQALGSGNELLASGQLTTSAPNESDFATTQTMTVAQSEVQKLAGKTPLEPHPAVAVATGALTPGAAKLVTYAKAHAPGTSGQCLALVQDYLQATNSPGAAVPRFAYAHQFGDWLNQGNNAAKVGLKKLNITNPYQAPPGAIVVVPYGAPGTSMPGAGDISIAAGNGQFINDHLNENYGGSAAAWNASGAQVVGIYVPAN